MMKKTPSDYFLIKFRPGADSDLERSLKARSSQQTDSALSQIAKRDLGHYYDLLSIYCPKFSAEEWTILFQALNGWEPTPKTVHALWAEVDDFLEQMDKGLIDLLRNLTPFECWAIYNAVQHGLGGGTLQCLGQ